ncbi:MAG: hypothetical protein AB1498_13260 [bacterium]
MKGKILHYNRKNEMLGRHVVKDILQHHLLGMIRSRQGKLPLNYILREGRGFRHK